MRDARQGTLSGEGRRTGETDAGQGCGSEGGGSLRGSMGPSGEAVFRGRCGCEGEVTEGSESGKPGSRKKEM